MRSILRVAGETPFEVVRQRVVDVAPAVEEAMASAAEQLIQRGRRETLQDALIRLLRARFGPLTPDLERRIETATTDELDRSIERVVTVARAEDVFGA